MTTRAYLIVSGAIFGLVAALHLLRVVNDWVFELGPWSVPMSFSWLGTLLPALLCAWAFRAASRDRVDYNLE